MTRKIAAAPGHARRYKNGMEKRPVTSADRGGAAAGPLRRGWTTGACATAATRAALIGLWSGEIPETVRIALPRGERPSFAVAEGRCGDGWAEAGIVKDAGDDPDITHGALIRARVRPSSGGVVFRAGEGVGTVTRPGLPIPLGEPAINPVPRKMMRAVVEEEAARFGRSPDIEITLSIPGGAALAAKTWNPRLGIRGGLSILGTTGIVRPFSCAAWIASIHRGIDVARASGLVHLAGATGATSENAVRRHFSLPEEALIDMGDFVGGMLKYLRRHPVPRLTIAGGFAKMAKLAQGARDLHSGRSTLDMARLGRWAREAGLVDVSDAPTGMAALERAGPPLADLVARKAQNEAAKLLAGGASDDTLFDTLVVDRQGRIVGQATPRPVRRLAGAAG